MTLKEFKEIRAGLSKYRAKCDQEWRELEKFTEPAEVLEKFSQIDIDELDGISTFEMSNILRAVRLVYAQVKLNDAQRRIDEAELSLKGD